MTYPNKIVIFGAGISGLVASINLAKAGFEVVVCDRRECIGGSPRWHPSVHQQVFDVQKTARYLDIDISCCFSSVKKHVFYFYGRKSIIDEPKNSHVCEKGQRSSSIENFLFREAERRGVDFIFNEALDLNTLHLHRLDGTGCIVATGLEIEPYKAFDLKYSPVGGFRASKLVNEGERALSFFGDYTNNDFAYVASSGDFMFSLLFSRESVDEKSLSIFVKHLQNNEGISFNNWHYSKGCVPLETNLNKNGVVLAGTISGMIDPFFLNGISGALISGKIAAMYFINREESIKEFKRFTRSFYWKRALKSISVATPLKQLTFPLFTLVNSRMSCVGVV